MRSRIVLPQLPRNPCHFPSARDVVVFTLDIKLDADGPDNLRFAGHTVCLSIDRLLNVPVGEKTVQQTVSTQIVATVDGEGNGTMVLPDKDRLNGDATIKVSAPNGQVLKELKVSVNRLQSPLHLKVTPLTPPTIKKDPARSETPAKLRGRVIDKGGTCKIANKQVIIWAVEKEGAPAIPVLATITDGEGYFSGDYPAGKFAEASATVAGTALVPVQLTSDNRFPLRLIIVVDGKTIIRESSYQDCACDANVPRLPDVDDVLDSPSTYTSDLGGGACVTITKPNRTLEEFDFYIAVRTTEPAIKGLTVDNTDEFHDSTIPDIIDKLLDRITALRKFENGADNPTHTDGLHAGISPAPKSPLSKTTAGKVTTRPATQSSASTTAQPDRVTKSVKLNVKELRTEQLQSLISSRYGVSVEGYIEAQKESDRQRVGELLNSFKKRGSGRAPLNLDNQLDWDYDPTFYQAATIAHGHLLHLKQEWIADGYSLGDLLYSLPLAPGQKKQIAVIDWERKEDTKRTESLEASDRLTASLSRDRDISEIVKGSVTEHLEGSSKAESSGRGSTGGISASVPASGALIGITGGASHGSGFSQSEASMDGTREIASSSLQKLRDKTMQSAASVRSQRSTVIQSVQQGESVRAQTEVVANYNHCHALTIEYFEVLRHFLLKQKLIAVQECLFVPLMMSPFDAAKALRWRIPLARALQDKTLTGAFDALDRIERNYEGANLPHGTLGEEELTFLEGSLELSLRLSRPIDNPDGTFNSDNWKLLGKLLGKNGLDLWTRFIKDQTDKDQSFEKNLGESILREFVSGLRIIAIDEHGIETELPLDAVLASEVSELQTVLVTLQQREEIPALKRNSIRAIKIESRLKDDPLIRAFADAVAPGSRVTVKSARIAYATTNLSGDLINVRIADKELDVRQGMRIGAPLTRRELRNARDEDRELAKRLLPHLNENMEFYHRALWSEMDPARRFMLLDGVIAPNSGGKSVASVVENRLIGIAGNCMVLPVVPSLHLDPSYKTNSQDQANLLDQYNVDPLLTRIAVPTRGVFAEAVMGSCNSCEKKDETRFWRWEESPLPDQPTAIAPLSTDSRRSEPPDTTAKDFAAPIINLQNAPNAPDPTGLGALLQVLGNANLFRDLSGLSGNQQNALAALQGALGAAQSASSDAAKLVAQKNLERNVDKMLESIETSKNSGLLDDQQARALTEKTLASFAGIQTGEASSRLSADDILRTAGKAVTNKAGFEFEDKQSQQSMKVLPPAVPSTGPVDDATIPAVSSPPPATAPLIVPMEGDLFAEKRSFFPSDGDKAKTGGTVIKVAFAHAPVDAGIIWTVDQAPSPDHKGRIEILSSTVDKFEVIVDGTSPGLANLKCHMLNPVDLTKQPTLVIPVSVPLFVVVKEDAEFDQFLDKFPSSSVSLKGLKDLVLDHMRAIAEQRLKSVNARLVWQIGQFNESMPGKMSVFSTATVKNRQALIPRAGAQKSFPADSLLGLTETDKATKEFDAPITIWPGSIPFGSNFAQYISRIATVSAGETEKLKLVAQFVGQILGQVLAHEVGHIVCGDFTLTSAGVVISGPKSTPTTVTTAEGHSWVAGDIMREGPGQTAVQLSGFDLPGTSSTALFLPAPEKMLQFVLSDQDIPVTVNYFFDPTASYTGIQHEASQNLINKRFPIGDVLPLVQNTIEVFA